LNRIRSLVLCESGATIVEFAFGLTAFLMLIFGIINISRVLWTLGSLHYAAESAARCASVNSTACGTASLAQAYALQQYNGESLGGTNPFTYSATGCGNTVTASYTYSLVIPLAGTWSLPLSATACFP
jgi:Flp pilus assembly protein TadG